MPFSDGVFTRASNSFSNPVTGTLISPTDAETTFDGYDTALTQLGSLQFFNVDDYDSPQAAVDAAIAAFGGIVWFPAAEWALGSGAIGLDLRNSFNIRLMGPFAPNGGGSAAGAVRYTGTGTAIDVSGAFGFEISGLEVVGTSSQFLIKADQYGGGGVGYAAYGLIHRNMLYGNYTSSTAIGISISSILSSTISNNTVIAYNAIRGVGTTVGDFSNAITIKENVFLAGNTNHLQNAGGWLVQGNTFQGTLLGRAYSDSAGAPQGFLLNLVSNFFSDTQNDALPWIETDCFNVTSTSNVYDLGVTKTGIVLTSGSSALLTSTGDQFHGAGTAAFNIGTGNNASVTNYELTAFGPGPATVLIGTPGTNNTAYHYGGHSITGPVQFGSGGTISGNVQYAGLTSGNVSVRPQAAAGTPVILWPTTSGTVATTATAPIVLNATTGALTLTATGTGSAVLATAPTISQPNIVGTITNDSAAAGSVGEYIESVVVAGSAVALTSGAAKTVTSISLTAGDWDVSGIVYHLPAATTSYTRYVGSISAADNALNTTPGRFVDFTQAALVSGGNTFNDVVPPYRISLSATTTIYLVALGSFTVSTAGAYGIIRARRVR